MNNMKDYHDLYLKVDALLIACVFETSKNELIHYFELDPAYYLSTPGYNWEAMFRFTNDNLKLISDFEKYQFTESTMRSGISMICEGYAEAINKLLKSYNYKNPSSYIMYLDANNLYGHSMIQLLPPELLD